MVRRHSNWSIRVWTVANLTSASHLLNAMGGRAIFGAIFLATASCAGCVHKAGDPTAACAFGELSCGAFCCSPGQICMSGTCQSVPGCSDASCQACVFKPDPHQFEAPERAWWWPYEEADGRLLQSIPLAEFSEVMSTPVVVPLDGKFQKPDEPMGVVFNTFVNGGSEEEQGILRAVRGDTGQTLWSQIDAAYRTNGVSSIAAGDLNGDGYPEFVTGAYDASGKKRGGVIAFDHTGAFLWRNTTPQVFWGGPTIAELDDDPADGAEVVVGSAVLSGLDGHTLCPGLDYANGDNGEGPLSTVADIDGDGHPEVVTGIQAWKVTKTSGVVSCTPMWNRVQMPNGSPLGDGFVAVARFNGYPGFPPDDAAHPQPQIVVVSHGTVRIQDWTGGVLMDPVALPGGGDGGPPTIADFDGDGHPEIGVAGSSHYTVFKPGSKGPLGGQILWSAASQDVSSSATGSSVFDFLGAGTAQVIYADECYLHVFDGPTGLELFKQPNTSCTAYEMPIIADVGHVGRARIVAPMNDVCNIDCPFGNHFKLGWRGLQALASPSDLWVNTRAVWNEHGYHITNINDDATVPATETPSFALGGYNSFRQNIQNKGLFDAPDLTLINVRVDLSTCAANGIATVTAEVHNLGALRTRPGVRVAFYTRETGGDRLLGVVPTTASINPGASENVTVTWHDPPKFSAVKVKVVADDDGTGKSTVSECRKDNNVVETAPVQCPPIG